MPEGEPVLARYERAPEVIMGHWLSSGFGKEVVGQLWPKLKQLGPPPEDIDAPPILAFWW